MIQHKQITIGERRLSYYDAGAPHKHVVVLVHGVGASSRYMVPLMIRLQREFRVLALDFPGFGQSGHEKAPKSMAEYADIHHAFINQLQLKPFVLVGNSFGCQIIVEQLVRYQSDARAAVLIGPTINQREGTIITQMWRYTQTIFKEPKRGVSKTILQDYKKAGPRSIVRALRTSMRDDIEQKISRVSQPLLIMRGTQDKIVPHDWAYHLASLAPNAQVVEVARGAHVLNMNQPEQTAQCITDFLQKL